MCRVNAVVVVVVVRVVCLLASKNVRQINIRILLVIVFVIHYVDISTSGLTLLSTPHYNSRATRIPSTLLHNSTVKLLFCSQTCCSCCTKKGFAFIPHIYISSLLNLLVRYFDKRIKLNAIFIFI